MFHFNKALYYENYLLLDGWITGHNQLLTINMENIIIINYFPF